LCSGHAHWLPSRFWAYARRGATVQERLTDLSRGAEQPREHLGFQALRALSDAPTSGSSLPPLTFALRRTSPAEALRLAPNLQVARRCQPDTLSARADSTALGQQAARVDRWPSVYSPLFFRRLLDVQDLTLEDIDRIEVITARVDTLGLNAVNGVINVITRSLPCSGRLVAAAAGKREDRATFRMGARRAAASTIASIQPH